MIDRNTFGCCHLFYECSENGACLQTALKHLCEYNKNLENGRIFYSKNANNFDASRYAEFVNAYNNLGVPARDKFEGILYHFRHCRRAIHIERFDELIEIEKAGFIHTRLGRELLDFIYLHAFKAFYGSDYEKYNVPKNGTTKKTVVDAGKIVRDNLFHAMTDGTLDASIVTEKYCTVDNIMDNHRYNVELYRDLSKSGKRIEPIAGYDDIRESIMVANRKI